MRFKDAEGKRDGICESLRWVESYERIAQQAGELPETRPVCAGDRESDMLASMVKARDLGHPADYLVRCQHKRVLQNKGGKLWAAVMKGEPLGQVSFEMPRGRGRPACMVTQELRAQQVKLADGHGGTLEVTCVIAQKIGAPAGSKPVLWRLLRRSAN